MNSSGHEERLRTGSDPSTVGCVGHGFLRSDRGTALIEYALLLGALVCAVIAGIHFGAGLGDPAYGHLSGVLASGDEPVASEELQGTHVTESESRPEDAGWQGRTYQAVSRPASAYLAVALLVIFLWRIAWRRRTRRRSSEKETAIERTEDRLQMKRRVLWRNILEDPRLLFKNRVEVRHLMTRDVTVVAKHTQADELRRLLDEKQMHHVLVCESDGQLQGVVSDRDLQAGTVEVAARVMTSEPMTVRPDTTASAAIAMMLEHEISCLPVVNEGQVCGILTRTDLLLSLQCMLQWWLRFAQTLGRVADCSDKIGGVQEASGRYLSEQRVRLKSLGESLDLKGRPSEGCDWESFSKEAEAFLATASELIAMQAFEGNRLSEMAGDLREITNS